MVVWWVSIELHNVWTIFIWVRSLVTRTCGVFVALSRVIWNSVAICVICSVGLTLKDSTSKQYFSTNCVFTCSLGQFYKGPQAASHSPFNFNGNGQDVTFSNIMTWKLCYSLRNFLLSKSLKSSQNFKVFQVLIWSQSKVCTVPNFRCMQIVLSLVVSSCLRRLWKTCRSVNI